jgi:hypothetical protein
MRPSRRAVDVGKRRVERHPRLHRHLPRAWHTSGRETSIACMCYSTVQTRAPLPYVVAVIAVTRLSSAAAWPHAVKPCAGPAHEDEYVLPVAASSRSALYWRGVSEGTGTAGERARLHDEVAVEEDRELRVRRRAEELVERADPDRCGGTCEYGGRARETRPRSHLKYTPSLLLLGDAPSVITPFAPCHGAFFMPAAATLVALRGA